ncbi:hypothetical protein ACFZBP_10515 [Streptomyces sp. NPDC008086]|uniref:hypothetical protein n=1 Tax=Streptomyces sp. NPDC008086 TaxID=3364807 RepID=UPI0036ED6529
MLEQSRKSDSTVVEAFDTVGVVMGRGGECLLAHRHGFPNRIGLAGMPGRVRAAGRIVPLSGRAAD